MRLPSLALLSSLLLLCSACGKQEKTVADSASPNIRTQGQNAVTPEQKPAATNPRPDVDLKPVNPINPPDTTNPFATDFEAAVREGDSIANEIRGLNRLGELKLDEKLSAVAQKHAEDMKARKFFDHKNPDGKGPFDRMKAAGIKFNAAAENIAMGVPTAKEVFEGWLASPGHKTNLLNKVYARHGIGYKDGIWVHVLAD